MNWRKGIGSFGVFLFVLGTWMGGSVSEVRAEVVSLQVSSSSDDVNQSGSALDVTSGGVWYGNGSSASESYTGLRFVDVPIPQGARVNSAHLEIYTNGGWIPISFRMNGDNVGNSLTFDSSHAPSGRSLTNANVVHSSNQKWNANQWNALNEINGVVQEVINRPDWQSGNAMSIIMRGTGSSWGRIFGYAWDINPSLASKLVIDYTPVVVSPTINPTPTLVPTIVTPTSNPTLVPTLTPVPTSTPTVQPTIVPSITPTVFPTPTPTVLIPTPTFTPTPTPTFIPTPTVVITPTLIPTPTPTIGQVRMIIVGDSSSDEYRADDNRAGGTQWANTTLVWDELLRNYRNVELGSWGNRSEPRRIGYEYNWARSGAEAHDLIVSGAVSGAASQVSNGLADVVYLAIGNNDFAYYRDGADIYYGNIAGLALQNKIDSIVNDITASVNTIRSANANVPLILGTIGDMGVMPNNIAQFPDASKRLLVTNAINEVNARLVNLAVNDGKIFVIDLNNLEAILGPRLNAQGNVVVGNEVINFSLGNEPHNLILADGIHGGTVVNGLLANLVINKLNEALGINMIEFSDNELLINAGISLATPTPTLPPTSTPTIMPTSTPIPTATPTLIPTVIPLPTNTPILTPTVIVTPTPMSGIVIAQIASSSDDANQINNSIDLNASALWLGNANGVSRTGLRFVNLDIPRGATITSARVEVYSAQNQWMSMSYSMKGENVGNSATFATSNLISSRLLTNAGINHSSNMKWSSNTWYQLDNVSNVIQEIVDRPDWQSGNSMTIILQGTGGNWARKFIKSYESGAMLAPRLVISYQ